jgi:regulator of sigma E protease
MMLAFQLFLSLSFLIILHEFGHFLPAKFFKIRVEKFYLFFDPWFSVLKKKYKGTEYGMGWLPLGGYVKIAGMIDESMDKEQMSKPPEDWEFRSKPAWQRLIVMVGGVFVNIIVGIVLYAIVLGVWGKDELPSQNLTYGVHCDSLLIDAGFRDGDKILMIGNEIPSSYHQIPKMLLLDQPMSAVVERNGEKVTITLPVDLGEKMVAKSVKSPIQPRIPCVVDSIIPGEPAQLSGMLKGDSIVRVGGDSLTYFADVQKKIKASASQKLEIVVVRAGEEQAISVQVTDEGTIGFAPKTPSAYFQFVNHKYTLLEAIPGGFQTAWETVTDYASQLKFIFSSTAAAKQVGGFGTFAKLFPPQWDWALFLERTAFISLILAFMNILPIPALDGGHVIFLLWEMITGRAASQKVMEYAQMIGMILLLGLMLYGNGMDLFRWLTGK